VHFDHEKLDVYGAAMDFVAVAQVVAAAIPKGQADLADQLRRAAASIVLNIAEGAGEFSKQEKARFYRFARRSATECAAILDISTRLDLVPRETCTPGRDLLFRVVSMLTKMIQVART
jgi:four helix bundle protein